MADTPVNSPLNRTGTAPKPTPDNRRSAQDDEMDAALKRRLGRIWKRPTSRSSGSGTPGYKPSWTRPWPISTRRASIRRRRDRANRLVRKRATMIEVRKAGPVPGRVKSSAFAAR